MLAADLRRLRSRLLLLQYPDDLFSVNRERFIRPSPDRNGVYQILEEVQGLRSPD